MIRWDGLAGQTRPVWLCNAHKRCQLDVGVYVSLHFYSHLYLLMCYLQKGSTPVMLAAGKGHTGVVDLLVHKYNCSLTEVDTVSAFVTSLLY